MIFSEGHLAFLGPGSEEKRYGHFLSKVVHRFQETGFMFKSISENPIILCSKAPVLSSRGILKGKKGKDFNGAFSNTELLFRIIHSVNQLTIYGAAANWCEQFDLTEEEKGRTSVSVDNKILTSVPREEVQFSVSLPTRASGTSLQVNTLSFEALSSRIQLGMKKKLDSTRTTGGEELFFSVGNAHFLELILNHESMQLFPKAQSLDQFWMSELSKFLKNMGWRFQFHQLSIRQRHLTL